MAALELKQKLAPAPLGAGTKVVRSPRIPILGANIADLDVGMSFLLVGPPGVGKTNAVAELIIAGYKVFIISTDSGGDNGINTIKSRCLAAGKDLQYISDHLRFVHVPIGDQVGEGKTAFTHFVREDLPESEEFKSFGPDVVMWEGMANYQANYIIDEFDDEDGGIDNFKVWGKIATATVRDLEYFFKIPTKYKIVSCQEGQKSVKVRVGSDAQGKPIFEDQRLNTGMAALKTGAMRSVLAAFDVVINLRIDKDRYMYYTGNRGDDKSKRRVVLPDEMPADFIKVWDTTKKQLGI